MKETDYMQENEKSQYRFVCPECGCTDLRYRVLKFVEESISAVYTMPEHSLQFDREDISYDDDLCDDEYICAKCDCKYHSLEEALEKGALIKKTND